MNKALSSLLVGERVVSRCDGGLLEVEYALFDRHEVLLSATASGHAVQELGYMTTAGYARDRLRQSWVTSEVAQESFAALRARGYPRRLARTPAIAEMADELGPYEAFEGAVWDAQQRRYTGLWLDLDALAAACPLQDAAFLMQALHLLLVLEEVREDVPVRLLTADATDEARSGERTWRKISLAAAQDLPRALQSMPMLVKPSSRAADGAEVREEVLRNLMARSTSATTDQPRLAALATAFARGARTPPYGSLVGGRSDPPSLLFLELRRHTDLLRGDAHLRDVAQFLTAMADRSVSTPELAVLAARAWLASGEPAHARHLAKLVVDDDAAPDSTRLVALEILDWTPVTHESMAPPPATPIQPSPIVVLEASEDRPAPPGASLPPTAPDTGIPDTERIPRIPDTARLPRIVQAPPEPMVRGRPEIVETLPLPAGLDESMLDPRASPRDAAQARIAMTRMARDLGRDYRLWYGTTLRTDVMTIDAMQRHLRRKFSAGPLDPKQTSQLRSELTRHGALLSEILARRLAAEWVDLESDQPGHWAMIVPPQVRVWPIGRVYRFFRQGHREADLVAFYTELEMGIR
ncbi:MAG TPA: hypothetical protein VF765_07435 [Polyangiaceae bacterium]